MSSWRVDNLGPESRKAHPRREREGFFDKYFGGVVLDVGYRGYEEIDVVPVLPDAIGIDLNYPGYDGKRLPFDELSVDTVYSSHTLEHIPDPIQAIRDWYRVLRYGGYLVITVPHQFLYEKRAALPSRWNLDHKRFYTPAALMSEIEAALSPNSYRLRYLVDDDENYDYSIPPERHAGGAYQIELVIQKIRLPEWQLEKGDETKVSAKSDHSREVADAVLVREAEMKRQLLEAFVAIKEVLGQAGGGAADVSRQLAVLRSAVTDGAPASLCDSLLMELAKAEHATSGVKDQLSLLESGIDGFIAEQNC